MWVAVCDTSRAPNCHIANCAGSIVKIWHTTIEMDKSNAVTVKYDKMPLPKPLPSDQVEHQIPDWVERERINAFSNL